MGGWLAMRAAAGPWGRRSLAAPGLRGCLGVGGITGLFGTGPPTGAASTMPWASFSAVALGLLSNSFRTSRFPSLSINRISPGAWIGFSRPRRPVASWPPRKSMATTKEK